MKTVLHVFCLLFLFSSIALAQKPYEFSVLQNEYERLDAPNLLTEGVWDDPSFVDSIGFDFRFDSTSYQTLLMLNNDVGGILYFEFDSIPKNLLIASVDDLIDPGYEDDKSLGYIASQTIGEPGNRIHKVEWNNVGFYNEVEYTGTANNLMNFQIWLYEGSNDIEWHFGPSSIKDNTLHELGGPTMGFGYDLNIQSGIPDILITLSGEPDKPSIDTIYNLSMYPPVLTNFPNNGTVYRFSSLFVGTNDIPRLESTIQVFPTLVENKLNIKVDLAQNEALTFTILDLMGKNWSPIQKLTQDENLDLSDLPSGFYFVNVRSAEAVWTQKIVKQ